jgi:dihydrofolate reductase
MDEKQGIGGNNQLLCRLPRDMKWFRDITTGHPVIMGRKTFESLPYGALSGRTNIVLTSQPDRSYANCRVCGSLPEALAVCEREDETFIIGGASVYRQALPVTGKIYLTRVHHTFPEADTFFPALHMDDWLETGRMAFPADSKNPYPHTFFTYLRKKDVHMLST